MPQPNRFVTARLSFRKGTTAEWADNDPILIPGEPAYDTSVNKFKIGDGLKNWSELPYVESTGGPFAWENNEKSLGLFPEFIQGQDDAINYNKFQHETLVDNAVDLFSAGVTGDPLVAVFELSVTSATGGAASIVGAPRHYNAYSDGETAQINAVAFNPYNFTGWTGLLAGEEDTATTTVTMSEARNLTANFSF